MRARRIVSIAVASFLSLFVLTGVYFALRYTVIADVREAVAAPDVTDPVAHGALLFQTRGCATCHALEAAGSDGDTGPNLTGINAWAGADYVRMSIATPNQVIAVQCPEGPCEANVMPQFGEILEPGQIDALTAYIMAQPQS